MHNCTKITKSILINLNVMSLALMQNIVFSKLGYSHANNFEIVEFCMSATYNFKHKRLYDFYSFYFLVDTYILPIGMAK